MGLGAALGLVAAGARAEQPIQPGMALDPEQLSPEAARYEQALQGRPVGEGDDSVENRRHFDDHPIYGGVLTGLAVPGGTLGLFLEANVWDRLAIGAAGGVSPWGPTGGGYVRLRPIVWGGEGENVLSAITIDVGYAYMMYGGDILPDIDFTCGEDCRRTPHHVSVPSHVGTIGVGLEHALFKGFSFRYGVGYGRLLQVPAWRCELEGQPSACWSESEPQHDFMTLNFGFSHKL